MIDPKKQQKKTDILETNLFKSISKQKDPCRVKVDIKRDLFPDPVILKAVFQLMPRFNVKPSMIMMGFKTLLDNPPENDAPQIFETDISDPESALYADEHVIVRKFKAVSTPRILSIIIKGTPAIPSIDGRIGKSYFDHQKSAGKLSKNGVINFKEINRYPTVNSGDKLFYISPEVPGRPGISFDGKVINIEEARPMMIGIGPGVDKTLDMNKDGSGEAKGYYLHAMKTGVVVIDWNEDETPRTISIQDEIEIQRLDYSIGNIGSSFTCPISARIGVLCNGFKINVNGRVQADVSEGAHIVTNNDAHVAIAHRGTTLLARNDITVVSAGGSKIHSKKGCITIENELIDSRIDAPKIVFEKTGGLLTNNRIKTNQIKLKGLNFSGVNTIYFGSGLFAQKDEFIKQLSGIKNNLLELNNKEKALMGKLQGELRHLTQLAQTFPDLTVHIKEIILATKTMNFKTILSEMNRIQARNNTKHVSETRRIFEVLAEFPSKARTQAVEKEKINREIQKIDRQMALLKLDIEGFLRKGATIQIFCGDLKEKEKAKPDYRLESEEDKASHIKVTGIYSHQKGFEIIR